MAQYSPGVLARFHEKVLRRGEDECWPWIAGTTHDGYGRIFAGKGAKSPLRAHVVAFELEHGPVPSGLHVLHACDNPRCCNPGHLRAGTNGENVQDKVARGRQARTALQGSRNPNSSINETIVREIRQVLAYDDSRKTTKRIRVQYKITRAMLYEIRHHRTWKHVTLDPSDGQSKS